MIRARQLGRFSKFSLLNEGNTQKCPNQVINVQKNGFVSYIWFLMSLFKWHRAIPIAGAIHNYIIGRNEGNAHAKIDHLMTAATMTIAGRRRQQCIQSVRIHNYMTVSDFLCRFIVLLRFFVPSFCVCVCVIVIIKFILSFAQFFVLGFCCRSKLVGYATISSNMLEKAVFA